MIQQLPLRIALFGQYYANDTKPIIREIIDGLAANLAQITIEQHFQEELLRQELLEVSFPTFTEHDDLTNRFDIFMSIGGDGTILKAVTFVRDSGIPIVGINAGRLGFLAKVQKERISDFLARILNQTFTLSQRQLISLKMALPSSELITFPFALNEITVSRKDSTSMITIDTALNEEHLTSYWADGLIISTPTGSTGYSLSCGGPILLPEVESLVLTPIAPHNLNARPLVIPNQTKIRLKVSGRESHFLISLDSRVFAIPNETELEIALAPFAVNLIEFADETFLNTLRTKMMWGEDKRN